MAFTIGQKVCLWQVMQGVSFGSLDNPCCKIPILKEVIVTITEIKTGVIGEWSRKPVSSQSLRGIGDDDKVYEKHWDSWPESQTHDFGVQWSMRDDGAGGESQGLWIPREALHVYNDVSCENRRIAHIKHENRRIAHVKLALVNVESAAMKPKGDITYCETHDRYEHAGTPCFHCHYNIPTAPPESHAEPAVK